MERDLLLNIDRGNAQAKLERVEPGISVSESIAQELSLTVFDQDEAALAVGKRLAMQQAGLNEIDKPIGVLFFAGPPGCLHGQTPIYDPVENTTYTVQKRFHKGKPFHVYSLKDGKVIIAKALPPVEMTKEKMWNFILANGQSIKVTGEHQFFVGSGYATARSLLARISRGETLFLPSISEHDLSKLHVSAQRLTEKSSSSQGGYRLLHHLYGLLPQSVKDTAQFVAPLLDDVLGLYSGYSYKDGRVHRQGYSRQHLSHGHLSTSYLKNLWNNMTRAFGQFLLLLDNAVRSFLFPQLYPLPAGRSSLNYKAQSPDQSDPETNGSKNFYEDKHPLALLDYTPEVGLSQLIRADYIGEKVFYDFSVPETENYWACGFFNHNCGKTEMAHAVAQFFFNDPKSEQLIRLDMSDYQQEHTSQKLTGSPPGYVGYGEEPALPHRIVNKKNTVTVVLLDEIEKAHPTVLRQLLSAFDKGELNARNGKDGFQTLDFSRTLFIMTSNIASSEVVQIEKNGSKRIGFGNDNTVVRDDEIQKVVKDAMKQKFPPEFLDRVDQFVRFHPLEREETRRSILHKFVNAQNDAFMERFGVDAPFLWLTREAEQYLLDLKDDKGGRGIKRALTDHVTSKLPDVMMGMDYKGRPFVADIENGETVWYTDVRNPEAEEVHIGNRKPREEKKIEEPRLIESGLDDGEGDRTDSVGEPPEGEDPEEDEETPSDIGDFGDIPPQDDGPRPPTFFIPRDGGDSPTIDLSIIIKEKGRKDRVQLLENIPLLDSTE